jgi:hypothetical protein
MDALKGGAVKVHPSDTDYALWMVESVCGPVVAAPGDIISHYDGILTVIDSRVLASVDTRPKGGDAPQSAAPFTGSAVVATSDETPEPLQDGDINAG